MGVQIDCATKQETTIPDFRPAREVPAFVTRYQFLAAMRGSNRAAALKTHIQGLNEAAQEEWQSRRIFRRDSPLIEAARVALGVSQTVVNNLFIAAGEIED